MIAVSVLSAALASTATYALALNLNAGAVTSTTPGATANADTTSTTRTVRTVDLVDIVAAAKPVVVTITAKGTASRGPFEVPTTGVGSGIILTTNGYILTNRHVIEGADQISVTLSNGKTY